MKKYNQLDSPEIIQYIFHPHQIKRTTLPAGAEEFIVDIADEIKLGCRLYIHDISSPSILFFHGNGETVPDYDKISSLYTKSGLNLIVATYRGYGWSNGKPTVSSMMTDCCKVFESCQQLLLDKKLTGALFVMGRSIGCVSAIEVCTHFADDIKGLIIDSGFADTLPLLKNLGLNVDDLTLKEEDGFGNRDKISAIKTPTLILHGSLDSLIPANQAERLQAFSGARTKKFFVVPGADHNNICEIGGEIYFSTIKGFIDDVTGQASWRNKRKKYRPSKQ